MSGPGEPAGTGTGESFAGLTPAPPPAGERATPAAIAYAAPGLRRGGGNAPPLYPVAARRRGIEGRVLLRVEVSPQGRAAEVAVIESSGHALLDEAAQRAVSRWSFEPARAGGVPVPGSIEIPVVFRLGG
ncbi:MAG: energy transducer TonB [Proteobacteria bacterium]|nr:energy transducer TonB [Pseudomonadota bacterium]